MEIWATSEEQKVRKSRPLWAHSVFYPVSPVLASACLFQTGSRNTFNQISNLFISFAILEKPIWMQKQVQISGFFLGSFISECLFPPTD